MWLASLHGKESMEPSDYGHFTYCSSTRSLLIHNNHHRNLKEHWIDEEAYVPNEGTSNVGADLKDSSALLHIVKCMCTMPREENNWCRSNIFNTTSK